MKEKETVVKALVACADTCREVKMPSIILARNDEEKSFCILANGSQKDYTYMMAALFESDMRMLRAATEAIGILVDAKLKKSK